MRNHDYLGTAPTSTDQPAVMRDFAELWRAAEKVVHTGTLQTPSSGRTPIERAFDPAAIQHLKESSARDITIGGAELAGEAMAAGLVNECRLFLNPVIVGGGKRAAGRRSLPAQRAGRAPLRKRCCPPPLRPERGARLTVTG